MQSKRKLAPIVNRDGIAGSRGNTSGREQEVPLVEIDATFARTLGISDGQKVTASIHVEPPVAHTVHIEPLTPEDWEIIELHATFLELNLVSQIRALPNPAYAGGGHPLTLHLSPTSTANIVITKLEPAMSENERFAKLSPDAEVIVAPKTRAKPARSSARENRSVSSRKSAGGRSGTSTVRHKSVRGEELPPAIELPPCAIEEVEESKEEISPASAPHQGCLLLNSKPNEEVQQDFDSALTPLGKHETEVKKERRLVAKSIFSAFRLDCVEGRKDEERESHDGEVVAESRPRKGSCTILEFMSSGNRHD